jgi:hypothetical protein
MTNIELNAIIERENRAMEKCNNQGNQYFAIIMGLSLFTAAIAIGIAIASSATE